MYRLGELYEKTKLKSPVYRLNSLNKRKLYRYIKENQYQYVVTTHLFAAQALTAIKKDYPIRFMQVATDYVSIPFWEETNPDYFIISSKELEKNFQYKKMKPEKIVPLGIPVAKAYRQEYKSVIPLPYTNNLSQYMKSSEVILSKPGGLTTTEIAVLGKPFIHTMPIPGCENYNADFFSNRSMSIQCHTIDEVVEKTKELLENQELQKEMIEKQKQYINPKVCDEITEIILREILE